MDVKKAQEKIISSIKEELSLKDILQKPSSYRHSVWFIPSKARFLYDDTFRKYEIIEPLIESGELIFKGIENHQGEKMLRYTLALDGRKVPLKLNSME